MGDCDSNFTTKVKSLLTLWAMFYATVKAEIRCYCNQPSCVSTGYMCKSGSDVCFTELFSYSSDLSKSRHGCVELLTPKKRSQCRPPKAEVSTLPVVLCCREDMCNYMNTMDINIQVHTQANRTQVSGPFDFTQERRAYEAAIQQDIWFKAAVIAVPIAGGFILILLILLASRMLRQDSKRQRQLLEMRQQQRLYSKPHFLLSQPCVGHPNCSFAVTPQNCKASHAYANACVSSHNWYADAISPNEGQYVYDKSSSNRNSMRETLLSWPKVHQQKSSTHV